MKTKIEIKSIFGTVLFEFEKEDNTIKDTLEEAIRVGANLESANLESANLESANLKSANLEYANLEYANLELFGHKQAQPPLQLSGLLWHVLFTEQKIKIGCQLHDIEKWESFSDSEIQDMHTKALGFWKENKPIIMAIAKKHQLVLGRG